MRMAGADQPMRILVVEDSKDIAQLLAGHLQRHGFPDCSDILRIAYVQPLEIKKQDVAIDIEGKPIG